MGTTYTLYKIDRGEMFELGKAFNSFFPEGELFLIKSLYPEPPQFTRAIYRELEHGWSFDTDKEKTLFIHKIQGLLYEWCGYDRILMLSDTSIDELADLEYSHRKFNFCFTDYNAFKQTGTRYV